MVGPIKKFNAGQISCALWRNDVTTDGRTVAMLKATVEKRFKDKNDDWKSSGSFSRNEIPLAIYCLQKAFEAIVDKGSDEAPTVEEVLVE